MKKIVPILIALLLIIGAIILVLSNNDKTSNDKQTDKQEQKEQETQEEQEGYPTINGRWAIVYYETRWFNILSIR